MTSNIRHGKHIGHSLMRLIPAVIAAACCLVVPSGCSPVTSHKILSTIFDGVPSLPPPEDLCKEYVEKQARAAAQKAEEKKDGADTVTRTESRHPPYQEGRCDDCHDKDKPEGLVLPKRELCFSCHTDFLKGTFVHGPAAVGDCLACHLPHTSLYSALLKTSKGQICATCHREKRLAENLHESVKAKKLVCAECHDPHSGNARYFLK